MEPRRAPFFNIDNHEISRATYESLLAAFIIDGAHFSAALQNKDEKNDPAKYDTKQYWLDVYQKINKKILEILRLPENHPDQNKEFYQNIFISPSFMISLKMNIEFAKQVKEDKALMAELEKKCDATLLKGLADEKADHIEIVRQIIDKAKDNAQLRNKYYAWLIKVLSGESEIKEDYPNQLGFGIYKTFFDECFEFLHFPNKPKNYKDLLELTRPPDLFDDKQRGRQNRPLFYGVKNPTDAGILPTESTPALLKDRLHKMSRPAKLDYRLNKQTKTSMLNTMQIYNHLYIAGISGTFGKHMLGLHLIFGETLSTNEYKKIIMGIVAHLIHEGHHSFYEVGYIMAQLSKTNLYKAACSSIDPRLPPKEYYQQFLTDAFLLSDAYHDFYKKYNPTQFSVLTWEEFREFIKVCKRQEFKAENASARLGELQEICHQNAKKHGEIEPNILEKIKDILISYLISARYDYVTGIFMKLAKKLIDSGIPLYTINEELSTLGNIYFIQHNLSHLAELFATAAECNPKTEAYQYQSTQLYLLETELAFIKQQKLLPEKGNAIYKKLASAYNEYAENFRAGNFSEYCRNKRKAILYIDKCADKTDIRAWRESLANRYFEQALLAHQCKDFSTAYQYIQQALKIGGEVDNPKRFPLYFAACGLILFDLAKEQNGAEYKKSPKFGVAMQIFADCHADLKRCVLNNSEERSFFLEVNQVMQAHLSKQDENKADAKSEQTTGKIVSNVLAAILMDEKFWQQHNDPSFVHEIRKKPLDQLSFAHFKKCADKGLGFFERLKPKDAMVENLQKVKNYQSESLYLESSEFKLLQEDWGRFNK